MKTNYLMTFISLVVLCLMTSCTKEDALVSNDLTHNRDVKISAAGFCEDAETSNYSNGHQARSYVEVNWSFSLSTSPPPPPGLIDFHVEFQAGTGYTPAGDPIYGTTYSFTHTYISTDTDMTERYSSLGDLEGNVQGRWRVRVESCEWSEWISYYF